MSNVDNRRHPRGTVALAVIVSPSGTEPVTAVIDLSLGGTCLEWTLPDDIAVGTSVRLCFLLGDNQAIELDGRVVRVGHGLAGIQFLSEQQDIARQLLSEIRSDE